MTVHQFYYNPFTNAVFSFTNLLFNSSINCYLFKNSSISKALRKKHRQIIFFPIGRPFFPSFSFTCPKFALCEEQPSFDAPKYVIF